MKAYPYMHKHPTSGQTTMSEGMDLLDWFAGLAMQELISKFLKDYGHYDELVEYEQKQYLAQVAYEWAYVMMKAREAKDEQP